LAEGKVKDFRDLKVWEKAHEFVLETYRESRGFPTDERFGLTAHIRRSASSITSNIAEGCGRETDKDFARFLTIAAGSASETEYQLLLARDLGYLSSESHIHLNSQVNEVKRMLNSLIQTLIGNSQ
jgi:four helix bundle protein